jgi:hypothetical protein
MEITTNNNIDAAQRVVVSRIKPRNPESGTDTTSFNRSEALSAALEGTPEARPEAVARARELINSVKYPPAEVIRGIGVLLAMELQKPQGK